MLLLPVIALREAETTKELASPCWLVSASIFGPPLNLVAMIVRVTSFVVNPSIKALNAVTDKSSAFRAGPEINTGRGFRPLWWFVVPVLVAHAAASPRLKNEQS